MFHTISKKQFVLGGIIFILYKKRKHLVSGINYGKDSKKEYDLRGPDGLSQKILDDFNGLLDTVMPMGPETEEENKNSVDEGTTSLKPDNPDTSE